MDLETHYHKIPISLQTEWLKLIVQTVSPPSTHFITILHLNYLNPPTKFCAVNQGV